MKSIFLNRVFIGLLGLTLIVCGSANNAAPKKDSAPVLSDGNQKLANQCSKQDQASCKNLIENLIKECEKNNAQSCIDSAVIFIKSAEELAKQQHKLMIQFYNSAINALIKACDLKKETACNSLKALSDNIFSHIKSVKTQCDTNKNTEACKIIGETKKLLTTSCNSGTKQDCEYLKSL